MIKNKRSVKNIFVDSKGQQRIAFPFLILFSFHVLVVTVLMNQISRTLQQIDPTNPDLALELLNQTAFWLSLVGTLGIGVAGLMTIYFSIKLSHRLLGPVVPIKRILTDLTNGNYSSRIRLRKNDELKSVAEALNILAETLEKKQKENQP